MTNHIQLEEGITLLPQFEKRGGLIPVVAQEYQSGKILMQGYINQEALNKTLESGFATFWSTSRHTLWTKGETSGDLLKIKEILVDCDQDAFVYRVELVGAGVCHTTNKNNSARRSCFYRKVNLQTRQLSFVEDLK